ncbi:hypothetical protein C4K14_4915 [Pseudomonas chlororaphis subsp. aureofaciens]|nr:hypothetical protein C4K14_4915 [Pseudomonas chlororaphis subsp. aureofaciens]
MNDDAVVQYLRVAAIASKLRSYKTRKSRHRGISDAHQPELCQSHLDW